MMSESTGIIKEKAETQHPSTSRISWWFWGSLATLTALRFWLGFQLHYWFWSNHLYDDTLLVQYANLHQHFHNLYWGSLVKNMGYPLFLWAVGRSHIPYSLWMSLLWLLVAALALITARKLSRNKAFLLLTFALFLFVPTAFDEWVGTRLYRNAAIAPFFFIFIFLLLLLCWELVVGVRDGQLSRWAAAGTPKDRRRAIIRLVSLSLLVSLTFTYNYYIKEDGAWELLLLCGFLGTALVFVLVRYLLERRWVKAGSGAGAVGAAGTAAMADTATTAVTAAAAVVSAEAAETGGADKAVPTSAELPAGSQLTSADDQPVTELNALANNSNGPSALRRLVVCLVALALPLGVFAAGTTTYKAVNQRYFGVAEVNTRTEGELGQFVVNIMRIDTPDRTANHWTPYAAIADAFAASPTLRSIPNLYHNIRYSYWFHYGKSEPVGEYLEWALRTALSNSFNGWNEAHISSLFAKVNDELTTAFKDGRLKRADRIQITPQMGGLSLAEIWNLRATYQNILLDNIGFVTYSYRNDLRDFNSVYGLGLDKAGLGYCGPKDPAICEWANRQTHLDLLHDGNPDQAWVGGLVGGIIRVYQWVSPAAFLLSLIGLLAEFVQICRRRSSLHRITVAIGQFFLLGAGLAVSFALAWYLYYATEGVNNPMYVKFDSVGVVPLFLTSQLLGLWLLGQPVGRVLQRLRTQGTVFAHKE